MLTIPSSGCSRASSLRLNKGLGSLEHAEIAVTVSWLSMFSDRGYFQG